jgi:predicted dehydrogenase
MNNSMITKKYGLCILILIQIVFWNPLKAQKNKIRIAVAGMTHGHVGWILKRKDLGDIELVGLAEPNEELAKRLIDRYQLDAEIWYSDLDQMLKEVKPEAVCAFGSIYDHLMVVEKCAPLGIHVMVEKPLAVSMEHALKMQALADKHDIHLLTNYETSWYASNHKIHELTSEGAIGEITKIVVHDGHSGPVEIGCSKEFLAWLTDPILNGGGAIIDFGCYGANLSTWLMGNQRPISVTAVTQQIKPNIYPNVDDEATIIVEYKNAQAIIQASWNWPFSRKDIEVYGKKGRLIAPDGSTMNSRIDNKKEEILDLPPLQIQQSDPFAYFASVINGKTDPKGGLYSLQNNMIVMEILSSAIKSAKERKTIFIKE